MPLQFHKHCREIFRYLIILLYYEFSRNYDSKTLTKFYALSHYESFENEFLGRTFWLRADAFSLIRQ